MRTTAIAFRVFLVVAALLPLLPTPEYWITLMNNVGLYSIVAIGLITMKLSGHYLPLGAIAWGCRCTTSSAI
jgi:branched-chain amino acid transport system permease protein